MRKKGFRAFTLIELLVVIAIIGILSSVVLASLNTARLKSRDARRISDVKQLQLALALFYDSLAYYPTQLSALTPTYISVLPTDPLTNANYFYSDQVSSGACTAIQGNTYQLGSKLEDTTNQALTNDVDATGGIPCTGANAKFNGTSIACNNTAGSPQPGGGASGEACYDVTP